MKRRKEILIMRDMKECINKAINSYDEHGVYVELTAREKELIEYGYIQCSLHIGYDMLTKGENFIMGLQEMVLRDSKKLKLNEFVKDVGENAINHGWWEQERSFGELIALCHSELSEALEEYRKGKDYTEGYKGEDGKLEGIPIELADVIIRIFDMCNHYGIDIESALMAKHEFNKGRPYKHGGKVI